MAENGGLALWGLDGISGVDDRDLSDAASAWRTLATFVLGLVQEGGCQWTSCIIARTLTCE